MRELAESGTALPAHDEHPATVVSLGSGRQCRPEHIPVSSWAW